MAIGTISNIYLLIFLPLIASLSCQLISKKTAVFYFTTFVSFLLLFLSLKAFRDVLIYEKIANDFELSSLSIALEFKLDILSATFLLLLIFLKIVTLLFFRSDIENLLDEKTNRAFYAVFLLHLFSLVGIFTSNNLFNLFLFFEIYAFSFFAIVSISGDIKLLKISFRYFCFSAASSLLIIFCFFVVYLIFNETNFDKIADNFYLLPAQNHWFGKVIFLLLISAILVKFFPIWLYFEKLRSSSAITSFFIMDSLFIKTLVGVFLILKFTYFFFGNNLLFVNFNLAPILIFLAVSLIIYSAVKLYFAKHLKLICIYFCLNNLGFMLAAVALQTIESLQALFFYILSFSLTNLLIFLFAVFLKRNFATTSITKISLVEESLILPLKLLIFFIAAFPMTFLFFANWYIAYSSFKLDYTAFLLVALIISNFAQTALAIKLIDAFFLKQKTAEKPAFNFKNYPFYLAAFWFVILTIYGAIFLAKPLNELSLRFASYLLSNTI